MTVARCRGKYGFRLTIPKYFDVGTQIFPKPLSIKQYTADEWLVLPEQAVYAAASAASANFLLAAAAAKWMQQLSGNEILIVPLMKITHRCS